MRLIRCGAIARAPQVLLRPSPADDGKRYDAVRQDYPELIYLPPVWLRPEGNDWAKVMPGPDDVQLLANVTAHSDLNVNFGSTMTLDFAIRDKPVINVAFDVSAKPVYGIPMWEYLQKFEHYQPVIQFGAARFARSEAEFAEHVNAYLRDPALDREGRQRFVNLEVGAPIGQASHRILEVLKELSGK